MAIRKTTEGVTNWSFRMPFPKDRYAMTCIEESFGMSKNSGNPMITRTWEIVQPDTVQLGDKTVNVGGQKITQYLTCKVKDQEKGGWDAARSDKAFGVLRDDLKMLGFDGDEIDDENPPLVAKGKTVDAIIYGKETQAFTSPTAEDLAAGRKVGKAILDSEGKEVKTYQLNIEQILGLSAVKVGVAF